MLTLPELLATRASEQPDDSAFLFLSDRGEEIAALTFGELQRRVEALARQLAARAQPGDRALLLFLPGLDFVVGFLACMRSGVIAVPMMVPRRTTRRDASAGIVANCAPRIALTHRELANSTRGQVLERFAEAGINLLVIDDLTVHTTGHDLPAPPAPGDLAFLQYTSGSTSTPKGVMVSHANLLTNLAMMQDAFETTRRSTFVTWLPLYHDMGLILAALKTMYVGATCVMMAPVAFIQRPMTWLRAIQRYGAEITAAPNFAYDLCVDRLNPDQAEGLDLSGWRVAINAAEPVRDETIERFAAAFAPYGFDRRSMFAGFGLAEATLMVTGGRRGAGPVRRTMSRASLLRHAVAEPASPEDANVLVSSGRTLPGQCLTIVDPDLGTRLGFENIGEIRLAGPCICRGYWQDAEATAAIFGSTLAGEGAERWLRTGDLGFIDRSGEVFITGRIKDTIIIRGMNHYPQDIEETVQAAHPALSRNCGAAFAIMDERGCEALAVVQEVERTHRKRVNVEEMVALIREAVFQQHELAVKHVLLARPGAVPKTTSGKIQRNLARRLWREGQLDLLN